MASQHQEEQGNRSRIQPSELADMGSVVVEGGVELACQVAQKSFVAMRAVPAGFTTASGLETPAFSTGGAIDAAASAEASKSLLGVVADDSVLDAAMECAGEACSTALHAVGEVLSNLL